MAGNSAEVADSDGESDEDVAPSLPPSRPPTRTRTENVQTIPDIDLGVDFNDFLSQSQRDGVVDTGHFVPQAEHSEGGEKSTGTTASLKRQIESEQRKLAEQKSSSIARLSGIKMRPEPRSSDSPTVAKNKRRHSELGTTGQMDGGRESNRKRQATYTSSSSRLRSSQSDLFTEEHESHSEGNLINVASSRSFEESSYRPEDIGSLTEHQVGFTARGGRKENGPVAYTTQGQSMLHDQDGIHPPLAGDSNSNHEVFNEYMQMSSGRISTSRSLMGNHESINLDFSDGRLGLDVNANPFGDASQQSVGDHTKRRDRKRPEAIFRLPQTGTISTTHFSSKEDSCMHGLFHPQVPGTDGAVRLREEICSRVGSSRSKSFVDPSVLTKYPSDDTQDLLDPRPSSSRKRRKTADGLALNIACESHEADRLATTVPAPETPQPRIESQGKKRGRKPKIHNVEPDDGYHSERRKEHDDWETDEVLAKHPSSELRLDDESTIGLPQEQYKPRPSCSRSKRIVDDEMPPPAQSPVRSVQSPVKQAQTSNVDETGQLVEPEDAPSTKLNREKKRKNKMKRAKTTAASLLKKSDKMLSDGEEDVVWVESKPASVKMKLPDPVEEKREQSVKPEQTTFEGSEEGIADTINVAGKEQTVVDAPEEAAEKPSDVPQTEEEPQQQAPKKRGRKKKTTVEIPVPSEDIDRPTETFDAAAEAPEEAAVGHEDDFNNPESKACTPRQVLKEKDLNTTHSTASNATLTTTGPESPEKQPPPTPDPRESSDRGPTKHSPINPTGGKVKYRVGLSRRAAIPPLLKIVRK